VANPTGASGRGSARTRSTSLRAVGLAVQPELGDESVHDAGTARGGAESARDASGLV